MKGYRTKPSLIKPVWFSEWAAPIVPLVKQDGSLCICGDYMLTVNCVASAESCLLPRLEDLLESIGRGVLKAGFGKCESTVTVGRRFETVCHYQHSSRVVQVPQPTVWCGAVFQRTMESLLRDIPNVCIYIDVLVLGETEIEHFMVLEAVLSRLQKTRFSLKRPKCTFMLSSLEYLGHVILAKGVRPTDEKKPAIVETPAPQNVMQLRSFLGMLTYYSTFLPDL